MIKIAYVIEVVQNHFYHSVKVMTPQKKKKNEKINLLWNTGHLDEKSDVKHHSFRCLIQKKCSEKHHVSEANNGNIKKNSKLIVN